MVTAEHRAAIDYRDALKYGLQDGLFKLQRRAHSNCLTDGEQYFWSLYHFFLKFLDERGLNYQEEFSLEDTYEGFV